MTQVINFYKNPNYCWMSNFYPALFWAELNIIIDPDKRGYDGKWLFRSAEHYYQAHKAVNLEDAISIVGLASAIGAMRRGHNIQLRSDWDEIQLDVMQEALRLKFTAHPDLAGKLISTGGAILHENSRHLVFGSLNGGQDWLGKLLMKVRFELIEGERK